MSSLWIFLVTVAMLATAACVYTQFGTSSSRISYNNNSKILTEDGSAGIMRNKERRDERMLDSEDEDVPSWYVGTPGYIRTYGATGSVTRSPKPSSPTMYRSTPERDIVDTAIDEGLTGLVNLVQLAGLETTLRGDGPFTIFAPTDDAFKKFSEEEPELLAIIKADTTNELLRTLLLEHALADELFTFGTLWRTNNFGFGFANVAGSILETQAGRTKSNGGMAYKVGDATVETHNVITSNGIVHIIDTVLV